MVDPKSLRITGMDWRQDLLWVAGSFERKRKPLAQPLTKASYGWSNVTPAPLGHWSKGERAEYFFIRYDTAREKVVERLLVPFTPSCMAFDGERFWYAEREKNGFSSILRHALIKQ